MKKFYAIIGNPPYQEETTQKGAYQQWAKTCEKHF